VSSRSLKNELTQEVIGCGGTGARVRLATMASVARSWTRVTRGRASAPGRSASTCRRRRSAATAPPARTAGCVRAPTRASTGRVVTVERASSSTTRLRRHPTSHCQPCQSFAFATWLGTLVVRAFQAGRPDPYFTKPPRPTQHPTFSGTGNEYQPKRGDALRLGSKIRYGSFHVWINVWVASDTAIHL